MCVFPDFIWIKFLNLSQTTSKKALLASNCPKLAKFLVTEVATYTIVPLTAAKFDSLILSAKLVNHMLCD